jgi:cell division protein FtsN
MAARGRSGRGSRTGTFLVLSGIVGVLTATFIAGVWTGRNWPVLVGSPKSAAALEPPAAKARIVGERPRPADPLPPLTFYNDLKAPLTAPPPPVKPARARPPALKLDEPEKADAGGGVRPEPAPPAAADASTRFTIQVAAYNVRPPAEALRAALVAAGHDARVVEADPGHGVRYRVQVGAFPTREAAREAAARLAAERAQPTFVTTR